MKPVTGSFLKPDLTSLKSVTAIIIAVLVALSGCTSKNSGYRKYSYEFFGTFDTMVQVMGYAKDENQFEEMAMKVQSRFEELNKLFDIYNDYEDINNIKTINDNAGIRPVEVRQEIIDLILFSMDWYEKTGGVVNIALGPVLSIWHQYREEGKANPSSARLPERKLLLDAAKKTDITKIEVDTSKNTVFLKEPGMSLDVGAVAKGFATEIVAGELVEAGYTSFIINSGGNVRVVGEPRDGVRKKWGIGLQDPDANPDPYRDEYFDVVYVTDASVVTSGDYQRYYVVDGQRIHHLIDPETLMPARYYRAVTVLTEDSAIADFLSTAAFILPYEKSRRLIESLDGVEALWVMPDGSIKATDGMVTVSRNLGNASGK